MSLFVFLALPKLCANSVHTSFSSSVYIEDLSSANYKALASGDSYFDSLFRLSPDSEFSNPFGDNPDSIVQGIKMLFENNSCDKLMLIIHNLGMSWKQFASFPIATYEVKIDDFALHIHDSSPYQIKLETRYIIRP
jgi:hypothetical protein